LDVPDSNVSPPKIADKFGHVPVLKYDHEFCIILHKWVSGSGRIATSDDLEFKTKLEGSDHSFRVNTCLTMSNRGTMISKDRIPMRAANNNSIRGIPDRVAY
jgi:hypothetical protein